MLAPVLARLGHCVELSWLKAVAGHFAAVAQACEMSEAEVWSGSSVRMDWTERPGGVAGRLQHREVELEDGSYTEAPVDAEGRPAAADRGTGMSMPGSAEDTGWRLFVCQTVSIVCRGSELTSSWLWIHCGAGCS